jgi:hypothetical protein
MILLSRTKLAVGEKTPEPRGTGPDGVRHRNGTCVAAFSPNVVSIPRSRASSEI